MYIDDGAIFACRNNWDSIGNTLCEGYSRCIEWLTCTGLSVELDKTELIFFKKKGDKLVSPPYIHLPLPAINTYYRVQAVNTLRYLGFFLDMKLTWA
ncbi:hypothetical protein BC827DRAFT_1134670 [Russula dissimulans]|jgi:hypothetical protein|nr:hypothetical protein BC827DRAFT_1148991 [Russula dissimulans]KAH9959361.1 hypothetical protein BC827DRAFT_1134670 [Russula dissimulans]